MELLIIAYHYFGDENQYKSGIYPVSPERFARQLDIVGAHYDFISEECLVSALQNKRELPEKACLITFDDGLSCQYKYAVPILEKKSIPAVFFIPTLPYVEKKVITAHKIHYLLANISIDTLLHELEIQHKNIIEKELEWHKFDSKIIGQWYRYDDEKTGKFKYFLNYYLPPEIAGQIISNIFSVYSQINEEQFCQNFYLSTEQLNEINTHPLFSLGLHTHTHFNIKMKDKKFIEEDLVKNFMVIHDMVRIRKIYGISFPFGLLTTEEFDSKLSDVVKKLDLCYGVTSHKAMNTDFQTPFFLSRFNVNDLPAGKYPIINFT